jgi:hypothetical protein
MTEIPKKITDEFISLFTLDLFNVAINCSTYRMMNDKMIHEWIGKCEWSICGLI